MDNTKKPEIKNPRENINPFKQILFFWIIPLLFRGTKNGLTTDDLTICLDKDKSDALGNRLEIQWEKEINRAKKKGREPRFRKALFYTFYKDCIVDGFLVLLYIIFKSVSPIILAQLLVQFQQPSSIMLLQSNVTDLNTTIHLNNTQLNRDVRSIDNQQYYINMEENWEKHNFLYNFVDDENLIGSQSDTGDVKESINSIQNNENKGEKKQQDIIKDNKEIDDIISTTMKNNNETSEFMKFFNHVTNDTIWLTCFLVIITLLGCIVGHHSDLRQKMVGARMRIACCSIIYRKTLSLSKKSAGSTPAGYLVNLLSNDVGRLDYGFIFAHYIWILPLQSILICYLISLEIGIASIIGVIGLLLKTIPVQTGLSRLSSVLRMKVAKRTDKRVGIMNELIQGIQVIKMYAWEKPFQLVVNLARKREVKQIRYASYIRAVYLSTMVFTERSTLFLTIAACIYFNKVVSADVVFSMAQFFNILQLTAAIFYPLAVSLGAEALVSLQRIEDYLMQEDHIINVKGLEKNKENIVDEEGSILELKNSTATWDNNLKRKTLDNINLKVNVGQLCAVIGPVGAGKSSFLQLLLGELPLHSGHVIINGELSYASQEPWLFSGTVRNNILFGLSYDRKRYQQVVKECALLTDFQQLPNGDQSIVGERGASLSGGQRARISLARAVYKKASIYLFDDPLSAVDAHVGRHLFDEVIGPKSRLASLNATRILVTHQVHFLKEADWIIILENGKISHQGTYRDLSHSELDFAKLLERSNDDNLSDDIVYDDEDIPYIDGVSEFLPLKQRHGSVSSIRKSLTKSESSEGDAFTGKDNIEEQADGQISLNVWKRYFLAGGNVCLHLFFIFVLILSQVVTSGSDYFVNYWTQQEFLRINGKPTSFTTHQCLAIYGGLIAGVIVMATLRSYMFFNICMRASRNLHNKMFGCILGAPLRFFDTNPSGRILNRFSRDMGSIDELLPKAMMEALQILLIMIGILSMVSIVMPSLLLALLVAVILFAALLKLYLRPAQDLKRLEGICRSPVFSHLSATLNGISTIRANNAQPKITTEFDNLQDVHSAVWQLSVSSNTALGLWLDCISTAFVACVAFSFIFFDQNTLSGNVGLAISQAMVLTGMVQYGIRQSAESIQHMTSVERVLQYTDLVQETSPDKKPPTNWPSEGKVIFNKMFLRYDINESAVLKNLNVEIYPGWKIGIVGRTGAGKSSLIGAIFRLAPIEGEILIDGIETGSISLESLRTNVSIIPQDPVLFSATIRYNLDPFNLFDDVSLWKALEDVELKHQIGHLDFMITEGGSNFSVGQRQLICLARAILRNNKILVLDEATANVDPQTDALIQKTIRVQFKHCTVLTVAHRLHTVMDSDRILVMEAGYAKEFDIPLRLLDKDGGLLKDMVEATGIQESESLKKIAAASYREKSQ